MPPRKTQERHIDAVAATYPAYREATVVLRDGSTVSVRPVRPDDRDAIARFFASLSLESRVFRFFAAVANADALAANMAQVDYRTRMGIVALAGPDDAIVGHAMYVETEPRKAELALAIADEFQGRGLGTILLGQLAEAAAASGFDVLEAIVKPENHRMLAMLRESGFPVSARSEPGEVHAEIPTALTAEGLRAFEDRERLAAVAAVTHLLSPRSLAVIGASRQRGTIGAELLRNVLAMRFNGPVYPVNPAADTVEGVKAFASILDIPGEVDLALVTVPAAVVPEVARQCADKGVRAMVVISAGFAESGAVGAELQRELVDICRHAGMRLVGPNCMGIINTAPEVSLDATFAPDRPVRGDIGFLSQSGGLGIAVMAHAQALGSGISSFVSVGNKADLSGNDFLQYWEADRETRLIMLYLESFGNPRKFARIARRVSRSKPILAVKGGRSVAGSRATSSHTGALLSASDITVDALFQQAGVIRTDTLAELFNAALLLGSQPVPAGNRVAIVTNAGGPAILCADACEAAGLAVPRLPESVAHDLAAFLPAAASTANPVDMLAAATGDDYRRAIEIVAGHPDIDSVIVIFTPPLVTRAVEVVRAVHRAARRLPRPIPILGVFMSRQSSPRLMRLGSSTFPHYPFPEDAARALSMAARYGAWRATPEEPVTVPPGLDHDRAAAAIATALARDAGWMEPDAVRELLSCYGIPFVDTAGAPSPHEAGQAAAKIGSDVALKAVVPGLLHKSDAGAVALRLRGAHAVEVAASKMKARLEAAGRQVTGFQVQRMATGGVEMLVGVVQDQHFGPVLACGAGGTATELVKDVAVRITPITAGEASRMVRSLKTFPLLDGYRGAPKADTAALEDVLLRVSAMVEAHPEVAEMDLNPLIVGVDGALVVDARVRLEQGAPRRPLGAR
ncbi:MAG TPA: GNAT family N-acetyltransferase [Candidatus Dormibacteraeota bacterium]|nr:GNAT family N-acetyltransferase [Candidatus Dormibacteraeota bacterium]